VRRHVPSVGSVQVIQDGFRERLPALFHHYQ
jgi:hypothetical protein